MPKKIVEEREIFLPPLPSGSESSLRITDIVYEDGSVKRLWAKDDGVQVLGLTADNQIIVIVEKNYAHLIGGYVEPNESPDSAARREMLEETGFEAKEVKLLSAVKQDSGGSERAIWLYLATNCHKIQEGEPGIKTILMPPNQFWQIISTYIMTDAGNKHNGIMSFALAALVFHKLGWLTFAHHQEKESMQ